MVTYFYVKADTSDTSDWHPSLAQCVGLENLKLDSLYEKEHTREVLISQ